MMLKLWLVDGRCFKLTEEEYPKQFSDLVKSMEHDIPATSFGWLTFKGITDEVLYFNERHIIRMELKKGIE